MKFWEAMKNLEEGKKIRCKRWNLKAYVEKTRGGQLSFHKIDHQFFNIYSTNDFIEEWELYEEVAVPLIEDAFFPPPWSLDQIEKTHGWLAFQRALREDPEYYGSKSIGKYPSFSEVIKGLKEGKRFSRPHWEGYISQRGGALVNESNDIGNFLLLEDFEASDWIEVK